MKKKYIFFFTRIFFSISSTITHFLRIHSYKCDVCHLHCSTKTGLKEHMQTHDPLNIIDSDLMQQQAREMCDDRFCLFLRHTYIYLSATLDLKLLVMS